MLIVLIADTHVRTQVSQRRIRAEEYSPTSFHRYFVRHLDKADLILHAGDVIDYSLLDLLSVYAPVRTVKGNWDSEDPNVSILPETLEFELGGTKIGMVHDPGRRQGRKNRLKKLFPEAQVIVFGHSHVPEVEYENNLIFVNPGSASGITGPNKTAGPRAFALLHVDENSIRVELRSGK